MTRSRLGGLVATVGISVWLVGCGSSAPASAPPSTIACAAIIDSLDEVPEGFEATVLDAVSFPTYELDVGVRKGPEGTGIENFTFSKFGLVVHADQEVLLEVADSDGAGFAFDWATLSVPPVGGSVRVGPCRGSDSQWSTDAAWVVFAGGTWLSEPACLTFRVTSEGESATHRLGFDKQCGT